MSSHSGPSSRRLGGTKEQERRLAQQILEAITTTGTNEGDDLPFAYFCPAAEAEGNSLRWHCALDEGERVVGVLVFRQGERATPMGAGSGAEDGRVTDRRVLFYESKEEAVKYRDVLIEHGWQPVEAPEVTFSFPGLGSRTLNRREKKRVEKHIQGELRKNPFRGKGKGKGGGSQ